MKRISAYVVVGIACFLSCCFTGCASNQAGTEDAAAAKTQVALQDNPSIAPEVKTQVEAAKQKEAQKMSAYAKEMSEKYKSNPPAK